MKYLTLAYTALSGWEDVDVTSAEFQRICAFYADLATELTESGELLLTEGLANPALSSTVRNRHGKAVVSDGPFAESKEVVASLALIDVADHERALELARRIVQNTGDEVEVRPIMTGPPEATASVAPSATPPSRTCCAPSHRRPSAPWCAVTDASTSPRTRCRRRCWSPRPSGLPAARRGNRAPG